jgi:ferredoxin--NADP+ reductase
MSEALKHLSDYDTGPHYHARVITNERLTPESAEEEVRELVLEVDRNDFAYDVGQAIAVLAPGDPAFGPGHHLRLYSVADLPERGLEGKPRIKLCVRRCSYVDEYSGEVYRGVASNYLCDRRPDDSLTVTGPFGLPFEIPEELDANLILIGSGTGIAPFRAFVKHIYRNVPGWKGRIWLFHGARSGLEMLYRNDEIDDFAGELTEATRSVAKNVPSAMLDGELARDALILGQKQTQSIIRRRPVKV